MRDADTLAEIRAWRDEFARSHGYDLKAMVAALRELDVTIGTRLMRGEPRQPVAVLPEEAPEGAQKGTGRIASLPSR